MKKLKHKFLLYCFEKVLRYLQNWRVDNAKDLPIEQWMKNNNTCLYLYKFIKENLNEKTTNSLP